MLFLERLWNSIEYEFNDVQLNGNNKNSNPDFYLGNVPLWNSIIEKQKNEF
jgi:hypothetical protein